MVTYLNRYSSKLASLTAPLRELTKQHACFKWRPCHEEAINRIKEELWSVKILSYYDPCPTTPTILQCDASQSGIGVWIRQVDAQENENIVAMASCSLTATESRYSNIERECLAVMYGLERFEYYLLGREVLVETDHSPLEQIFKKKNLAEAPTCLQRMLLRCLGFNVQVKYKPGKSIPVADALSRLCVEKNAHSPARDPLERNIQFIANLVDLTAVKLATSEDETMNLLKDVIFNGWPPCRKSCPQELWEFWNFRCDLVLEDGLVLKGSRIVIPKSMRNQVLQAIHVGHQGETKCILLARESVFWPGISTTSGKWLKIANHVTTIILFSLNCQSCSQTSLLVPGKTLARIYLSLARRNI